MLRQSFKTALLRSSSSEFRECLKRRAVGFIFVACNATFFFE